MLFLQKCIKLLEEQGARFDPGYAREIAKDVKLLEDAYDYWSSRFDELGERLFEGGETPGLKLLKNSPLHCLSSLSDIALHIYGKGRQKNVEKMLKDIELFSTLGKRDLLMSPIERRRLITNHVESLSKAIRAIREIYDGCRRYYYCKRNSEDFDVPLHALLALYFQEGAFAITPPESSYKYAPLIETISKENKCRTSKVTLGVTAERPGFVFFYNTNNCSNYELLTWNLLAIGGLDHIVNACLFVKRPSPLATMVYKSKGVSYDQKSLLIGLAISHFEYFSSKYINELNRDNLKALIESSTEDATKEFWELIGWHNTKYSQQENPCYISGYNCFDDKGNFAGDDTYGCLRVQSRWFASRRLLLTLLAWCDRLDMSKQYPILKSFMLSPLASYLRFHVGEVYFVYFLLQYTIKRLNRYSGAREDLEMLRNNKKEWKNIFNIGKEHYEREFHYREQYGIWHDLADPIHCREYSIYPILQTDKERKANIVKELLKVMCKYDLLSDELNKYFDPNQKKGFIVSQTGFKKVKETIKRFSKRLDYYDKVVQKAGFRKNTRPGE